VEQIFPVLAEPERTDGVCREFALDARDPGIENSVLDDVRTGAMAV
jgi:hypothetical protein